MSQIKGAISCLLDRNAEQILTEHVFLPLRPVPPSSASTALRGGQRWHWKLHHLRCNQPMGWSLHPNREWHILLVLSLSRSSFAVAIKPSINVVHCWARPAPETTTFCRMSETAGGGGSGTSTSAGGIFGGHVPCLVWGLALLNSGGRATMPVLARAWSCCVQLLRASSPPSPSQ